MKTAFIDIEANGLLPELDTIWCAVVKDLEYQNIYKFTPDSIDALKYFLLYYDCIIGHNIIQYDLPALKKVFGWEWKGKTIDTLLMSRTQKPNRKSPPDCPNKIAPHSLEAWGWRLGDKKLEHEEWDKFSLAMLERCEQDCLLTEKVYHALLEEGSEQAWERAHKLNFKLFENLQKQEERGWTVDVEHIRRSILLLNRWIDRVDRAVLPRLPLVLDILETKKDGEYNFIRKPFKKDGTFSQAVLSYSANCANDTPNSCSDGVLQVIGPFSRVSFRPVNLNSNVETKNYLLSQGWEPTEWNMKNGKRTSPKFSKDDEFKGIQGSLGRLVAKRIQCRQRKSILEGWCEGVDQNLRIYSRVNGIATTGRLKHSTIVNVPSPDSGAFFAKQMRQVFIPKDGWLMVGVDSAGNQMRQLVSRMRKFDLDDEEFSYAVLNGKKEDGTDLHSVNARRAGLYLNSGQPNRTRAKNFFYGCILFGAGDAKTGKIINGTSNDGRRLKEEYFKQVPGIKKVIDKLTEEWRASAERYWNQRWNRWDYKNGYITGLDGRPILVESEHMVLCYALQSDEAIQMATAYNMVFKWAEREGWEWDKDWGMLIWMHDEFQMEARPELVERLGEIGCEAIKWSGEYYNILCPHAGEMKVGSNWSETH